MACKIQLNRFVGSIHSNFLTNTNKLTKIKEMYALQNDTRQTKLEARLEVFRVFNLNLPKKSYPMVISNRQEQVVEQAPDLIRNMGVNFQISVFQAKI